MHQPKSFNGNPFSQLPKGEVKLVIVPEQPSAARKSYLAPNMQDKSILPMSDSVGNAKPKVITVYRNVYAPD